MERRKISQELRLEAVKLVRERGVSLRQEASDLNLHETVLHKWVNAQAAGPVSAFPGNGHRKPEQLEIEQLHREMTRLKAERDTLKGAEVATCKVRAFDGLD